MTLRPLGCRTMALFIILVILLWGGRSIAQKKQFKDLPPVTPADFTLPASPAIDSNSTAVILANLGQIHFVGNESGWFSYVYKVHERIKILNKKAFGDAATVHVRLYSPSDDPEKLDNLVASTFNLDNGQLAEVKLDKKDVFEDRPSKEWRVVKWTMPAIQEGSIIDYSYTITSNYNSMLPTWNFQSELYPCLSSELQIDIPEMLLYTVIKQGIHPYAVDKGSEGAESYSVSRRDDNGISVQPTQLSVDVNTIRHQWVMKDIPAFHEESFLTTPENFVDKLDFQLEKTYDGEQYHDFYNSWKQATDQLLSRPDFGKALDDDNQAIDALVQGAIGAAQGPAAQARAIYYYVCQHFTCDNHDDLFMQTSLPDVVKRHGGTVGDINLLLVSMFRKVGVQADPVVLSTRDFGVNLASYPVMERLNYVIARAVINGKVVYLDGAHPNLGFGQLDEDCYNGHARIISNTDSGSVYFNADSLREKRTTFVLITQADKGLAGTWTSQLGPQKSYDLREKIGEQGKEAYFKDIQTSYGNDLRISDGDIDSLDLPGHQVRVHYAFTFPQDSGDAKIYVNPFIGAGIRENPFKAADRKYPIEMPYTSDDVYVFSMQIPDGYAVDELPKSARVSLNGTDGSFEYLIGSQAGMVQLRCRLVLNKANFSPNDYSALRDFYSMVVKKEAEEIVLKKN